MKKILLSLVAAATLSFSSFGQAPEGFKYQAVVRDAGNAIINNQAVGIRMTIFQGSVGGTTVYSETFATNTNAYGLVSIQIGNGTVLSGTFGNIDWANGPFVMETAIDVSGGTNYSVMGSSQLLSVPYALYAKTSGNGQGPAGSQGIQGPAGVDGTNGTNGIDGVDGVDGATGPQGPIGVDGTNGTNGISAYQVWLGLGNVGTEADFINSLTGPTGPQGIQGPAGTNGIDGATGTQGLQGPTGPIGLTGATGTNGSQGIQGPAGTNGMNGATGTQGLAGTNGIDGAVGATGLTGAIGSTGPQGLIGLTGADGATGPQGSIGLTGATGSVGTTGSQGPQGSIGLAGATGAQGIQGLQGNIGAQGPIGATGSIGLTGAVGSTGAQGIQGITGAIGPIGVTGAQGSQGLIGLSGPQGATGLLTSGAVAGNTPYWSGSAWVVNNSNIHNNGAGVGIGTTTPSASAKVEIASTTQGFLPPRMTTAQRDVIASPVAGLTIYNTTSNCLETWDGQQWYGPCSIQATSYPLGSVFCDGIITKVYPVLNSATGETWMDRNLGASQVATSSTDVASYGDLYQWGRRADGHQCRTSATTATLSSIDQPAHDDFILAPSTPIDWRSPKNDNLWQGVNGVNNPCPSGYRLPTQAELYAEYLSWGPSSQSSVGAFASPLKLSTPGRRIGETGIIANLNSQGTYWSSTPTFGSFMIYAYALNFFNTSVGGLDSNRAHGRAVRCIKD